MTEQEVKERVISEVQANISAAKSCSGMKFFAKQLSGLTVDDLVIYAPDIPVIVKSFDYNTDVYYYYREGKRYMTEFDGQSYLGNFVDVDVTLRYNKLDTLLAEDFFKREKRPLFVMMKGEYNVYSDSSLFNAMKESAKAMFILKHREGVYNHGLAVDRVEIRNYVQTSSCELGKVKAKAVLGKVKAQSGKEVYIHLGNIYEGDEFVLNNPIFRYIEGNNYVSIFEKDGKRIWAWKKFLKGYCC